MNLKLKYKFTVLLPCGKHSQHLCALLGILLWSAWSVQLLVICGCKVGVVWAKNFQARFARP